MGLDLGRGHHSHCSGGRTLQRVSVLDWISLLQGCRFSHWPLVVARWYLSRDWVVYNRQLTLVSKVHWSAHARPAYFSLMKSCLTRQWFRIVFLDHEKRNILFGTVQLFHRKWVPFHRFPWCSLPCEQSPFIQVEFFSHFSLLDFPKIRLLGWPLIQSKEMSRDLWPAKQPAEPLPSFKAESWTPTCLLSSPFVACPPTDCINDNRFVCFGPTTTTNDNKILISILASKHLVKGRMGLSVLPSSPVRQHFLIKEHLSFSWPERHSSI